MYVFTGPIQVGTGFPILREKNQGGSLTAALIYFMGCVIRQRDQAFSSLRCLRSIRMMPAAERSMVTLSMVTGV